MGNNRKPFWWPSNTSYNTMRTIAMAHRPPPAPAPEATTPDQPARRRGLAEALKQLQDQLDEEYSNNHEQGFCSCEWAINPDGQVE